MKTNYNEALMSVHIKRFRNGFRQGYTRLTSMSDKRYNTGIELGMRVMKKGEAFTGKTNDEEQCFLLMMGSVEFSNGRNESYRANRESLLDESPSTFIAGQNTSFTLKSKSKDTEIACISVQSSALFEPRFFKPSDVETEKRGKGKLNNTAFRIVRTVFNKHNMPESSLVVGEVVTPPGRWSSYPPHHHPQPEIYFYRFFPENGYGFAQVGEDVHKVKNNDLIKIPPGKDHPQAAAPGYTMWYLWVIRHLRNNPYINPEFTKEHERAFK